MKKSTWIFLITIVAVLTYLLWPQAEVTYPAGVLVKNEPQQKNIQKKSWQKDDYKITALASFHLKARVLSKESYSFDRESDLSPIDLALGWKLMSDQAVLDKINISQSNRWYHWSTESYPIPRKLIETESANMHIIPANKEIEDKLDKIIKGNVVEINGYLVFIESNDGWKWKSSLTRNDTGGGSCEVIWVEKLSIMK